MPADLKKARELFLHAVGKLPADEWPRYLAQACGGDSALQRQVEHLLQVHRQAGSFLERPAAQLGDPTAIEIGPDAAATDQGPREGPGTLIGPYQLAQQLGEGGMGTVFLAEQSQPVRRTVALKIIKPGMDSGPILARFEAERQALALMDHPNIAKVYDGGTLGTGRPYFVMELVQGLPITDFCDQHRLSLKERLELFVPVCQAVQHAHQKGIIHRDLKPSNVLVCLYDGRPVPKVIDFGIAKAIGAKLTERTLVTGLGAVVGTPEYMSPEQAELNQLDIDTRSDIYSLGVLLYELLTGTLPLDRQRLKELGLVEALRLIREEEPPRPSVRLGTLAERATVAARRGLEPRKLCSLVRGELDWIAMKALDKDRNRRYQAAGALAADVQHYLQDEPVQACPPSAWYRFRKFARRKKTALVVAAGVLLALAGTAGGLGWWLFQRAAVQRDVETALADATAALEKGDWPAAEAILDRAEARLASWGAADLRQRVGRLQADLEAASRLETIYLDWQAGSWHQDHQRRDRQFAEVFRSLDVDPNSQSLDAVVERLRTHAALPRFAVALDLWALLRRNKLKREEGDWRPLIDAALRVDDSPMRNRLRNILVVKDWPALKQLAAEMDPVAQSPLTLLLAGMYLDEPRDLSAPDLSATLDFLRKARRRHPDNVLLNVLLAGNLSDRFRHEASRESIVYLSAALAVRPKSTAILSRLAFAYISSGDFAEGLRISERILDLASSPEERAEAHDSAGIAWKFKGDYDRALAEHQEAIRLSPDFAPYRGNLAATLSSRGDYNAALAAARESQRLTPDQNTYSPHELLGTILSDLGRWEEAIAEFHKELRCQRMPAYRALTYQHLANTLRRKGDLAGSLQAIREAIACDPDHPVYHQDMGNILRDLKRFDEAIEAYRKAIQIAPGLAAAHSRLALSLHRKRRYSEAEAHHRLAVLLEPKNAAFHHNFGLLLNLMGRYSEAIPVFDEAIRLNPKLADAHSGLGIALQNTGQLDKALQAFHKAIAIQPGQEARYQLGVGSVLVQKNDPGGAEKAFRRSLELEPKNARALDNLGLILRSKRQGEQAIAAHRKALELDPELPHVRRNLALALMDAKRWAEAQKLLGEQIARNPNDAWAYDLLGQVLGQQGKLDEAAQALQRSLQLAPRFANPYLHLGFTRQLQGRFTEALAAFQFGHELGVRQPGWKEPSEKWLRQAEKQVERGFLLDAVLRGAWKPADAAERIDFAQVAKLKKRFAAAVRLYEQAFAEQPRLLEDAKHHRYDAACYAARAAAGEDADFPNPDAKERARLRQLAFDWLRGDLALWAKQVESGQPVVRTAARQMLRHWQRDPDLTTLRDQDAVDKLPQAERDACRQLWADVDALLRRTQQK
jgi:tetratricopeptide (TPR) repeat protein/serine/threonine protein kinase